MQISELGLQHTTSTDDAQPKPTSTIFHLHILCYFFTHILCTSAYCKMDCSRWTGRRAQYAISVQCTMHIVQCTWYTNEFPKWTFVVLVIWFHIAQYVRCCITCMCRVCTVCVRVPRTETCSHTSNGINIMKSQQVAINAHTVVHSSFLD